MIYVKMPRIVFKVLNVEFIISYQYSSDLLLLKTLRTKWSIQFCKEKVFSDFIIGKRRARFILGLIRY
jgi:hypothetical protein